MRFKSIEIKNFRNFDNIKVDIGNKNVFFGMNDIGKTNFLYALRCLFDRNMRKFDLTESDFHKRNIETKIEITACIDIKDADSPDTEKLRAKMKDAICSSDAEVFIRFTASYNNQMNCAEISMQWGGDAEKLKDIRSNNNGYFDIDSVFNVIYINSYIDLQDLFKKNIRTLIKNKESEEEKDSLTENNIKTKVKEINQEISKLSGIQEFQNKLTPSYRKMRDEDVSIGIKSTFAINHLYSDIVPFIQQDNDDNEYPTAGEGRKKLLAYSIYNLLSEETAEKKINLFLIEEPETHIHRSMQSALSHFLFNSEANDNKLNYLFISTHSPFILSEMDDLHLIRLYNPNKITASSESYVVPDVWKTAKKKLNRALSESIFADSVLLVEGESECVLFERVLTEIDPYYESKGVHVLSVEGVGFEKYIDVLSALNIRYFIKTDNDITKIQNSDPALYRQSGFERINHLVKYIGGSSASESLNARSDLSVGESKPPQARTYYDNEKTALDSIRVKYALFLSHCNLEEDLLECLGEERFCELLKKGTAEEAIKLLKSSKQQNMVELASKLSDDDCMKIYKHYNFASLRAVRNETN